jgi:hypothetical protein
MSENNQTNPGGFEGALDGFFGYLSKARDAVFDTYAGWQATFGSEDGQSSSYTETENYPTGSGAWSAPPATSGSSNTALYIAVGVGLVSVLLLTRSKR